MLNDGHGVGRQSLPLLGGDAAGLELLVFPGVTDAEEVVEFLGGGRLPLPQASLVPACRSV